MSPQLVCELSLAMVPSVIGKTMRVSGAVYGHNSPQHQVILTSQECTFGAPERRAVFKPEASTALYP